MYGPDQTDYSAQILPFIKGFKKLNARRQFVDMAPGEKRQRNRIYRAFAAPPDYFAAIAYDTANLIRHCLSRPGVTSPSQFVQALKTLRYENSVTSPTSFDKTGECIKPLHLLGFTN